MKQAQERGGALFTTFLLALFVGIIVAGLLAFVKVTNVNPANPYF